ncbi:glycosyltransferase family 4 protein [Nocardioides zeae]|uniref:Glycosyltransferase family 4 protein n=1 Tax=Nocardioides imazamoxiresistens TaxID=3231893 RepID=A0ABU3Q1D8_9ACTN|nr:glycosyltransferase family 4 protein [Nocardioides zeae]MDT9595261.1 glycosyltransferase family 4 protein [Nocardioides zeae]
MSGLRVAYVSTDPGIDVLGTKGASVHVQAVVRSLLRRGAHVDLVTPRADGDAAPDLAAHPRVRVHRLPRARKVRDTAAREAAARTSDAAVAGVLDDLHAAAPLDLVHERYALWGRTATAWAHAQAVPSVLEVNAPLPAEQSAHRVLVGEAKAYAVARDALSHAGAVFGVTDAVAGWARGLAADPGRVTTIGNGVDTRAVTPAATPVHDGGEAPFTLGFVGTLKAWHGVETLLEALALLVRDADVRLLVVGDGPRAQALRDLAERLGVAGAVRWTGAVPSTAVAGLLQSVDVACAPYPALEDFYFSPLKVTEYLAAGLPVVASAVGGLPALLGHGTHGELVAPDDPAALAAAVTALRTDPVRRAALRERNREAALGRDWDHVAARTLAHAGVAVPPLAAPHPTAPHPIAGTTATEEDRRVA